MEKTEWQFHYDAAKKAFEAGEFDTSLDHLEKIVSDNRDYADVFNMLGLVYYNDARFEDAIASFEKAVEINPDYTEAQLNLSVVLNELGRFDRSSQVYARARASRKEAVGYLDPYVKGKLANMHAGLGTIYKDLGFYTHAAEEYRKALDLSPGFVDIKTDLGVAYRDMKDYDRAVTELVDAVNLNPDYAVPRIQLGLTYYVMGESERAKSEWLKVLKLNPGDKMARMYMNLLLSPSS